MCSCLSSGVLSPPASLLTGGCPAPGPFPRPSPAPGLKFAPNVRARSSAARARLSSEAPKGERGEGVAGAGGRFIIPGSISGLEASPSREGGRLGGRNCSAPSTAPGPPCPPRLMCFNTSNSSPARSWTETWRLPVLNSLFTEISGALALQRLFGRLGAPPVTPALFFISFFSPGNATVDDLVVLKSIAAGSSPLSSD